MRREVRHEARDVLTGMFVMAALGALLGIMMGLAI